MWRWGDPMGVSIFRSENRGWVRVLRSIPTVALVVGLLLAPARASGQEEYDWQADVFSSLLFGDGADDVTLGLRGGRRVSDRVWLEARLSHLAPGDLDIWFFDASAKVFFDLRGRSRWYLSAGPGRVFSDLDEITDGPFIFHAGLGVEIDLGERVLFQPRDRNRLYLRPEILARWGEGGFDTRSGDLSLSIGWRF